MLRRAAPWLTAAAITAIVVASVSFGARTKQVAVPADALAVQRSFVQVVQTVSPSVVQIQNNEGLGSGVVLDKAGHIVTNAHVVGDAKSFVVTTSRGKQLKATLVATFVPDDIAVIKVTSGGNSLRPAIFADSSKLKRGDLAFAIGNPLGLRSSVTQGIVSAFRAAVPEGNGAVLPRVIQTSAPINPGNSGGALADIFGRVIGVPTLGVSDPQLGGAAAGIGFALPSNLVKDIAGQMVKNGKVVNSHRAYLGIQAGDTNGEGVLVGPVTPNGPAAKAGIKEGDLIVAVNGKPTPTAEVLTTILATLKPGQKVKVTVRHQNGDRETLDVTLGEYPGS